MSGAAPRDDVADVLVSGGGPAGAALAILLGRAGLTVELYERQRFPRDKPCGEGLMPAGVAVLERLGLREAVGGARLAGVRYHGWGRTIATGFPTTNGQPGYGLGQRRLRLDQVIFEAARSTPGVRAHEGVEVESPVMSAGRVRGLRVAGAERRARLVVAADGARSPLRRALGLDRPMAAERLGVRAHFALSAGVTESPYIEVFLGEGRELYVTPLPDRQVLVAALTDRATFTGSVRGAFAHWIATEPALAARLDGAISIGELAGRMPLGARARRGVVPGLVLLGDAAGFVDAVTGSGMAQALLSAELLAGWLVGPAGLEAGDDRLEAFERERRARLADWERLTRFVLMLSRSPRLSRGALVAFGRTPGLFRHLVGVAGGSHPLLPG